MKGILNPFLARTNDDSTSANDFISLFNHTPIDVISAGGGVLVNKFIRSAPGGGKSTLLRLFNVDVLTAIYEQRRHAGGKEIYEALANVNVLDDTGIRIAGLSIQCSNSTFAEVAQLGLPDRSAESAFFRLLNARVIIAALEAHRFLLRVDSRAALRDRSYSLADVPGIPPEMRKAGTVGYLLDWAAREEGDVCRMIDSFDPQSHGSEAFRKWDKLYALHMVKHLVVDSGRIGELQFIVMLDDVQYLERAQRQILLKSIAIQRYPVKVWIAERLDALDLNEFIDVGDRTGRDVQPIQIEDHWRTAKGAYARMLQNIADRRVDSARDQSLQSFVGNLEEGLDHRDHESMYLKVAEKIEAEVSTRVQGRERFREWLESCRSQSLSARERAIQWAGLSILLAREEGKSQQTLDFSLGTEALAEDLNDVKTAAELFISRRFKIPYYYGFDKLVQISSQNVEQFLYVASALFSEMTASRLLRQRSLSPERQQTIVRKSAVAWTDGMLRIARLGHDIRRLLDKVGEFCAEQTFRENAPYAPGVTGFGILSGDWADLCGIGDDKAHRHYAIAQVLRSAIANNLLETRFGYKCKGNEWTLFYLNRLFCVTNHLPLGYGGWREWRLSDLARLVTQPRRHE